MLPLPLEMKTLVTASLRRPTLFFCFSIFLSFQLSVISYQLKVMTAT
jgi:hypothetical protein